MPKTTLLRKQVTPTGSIQPHGGGTVPEGFLSCDGTIVNIADYPRLYAAIGTTWGYGLNDGLTFHLPDLRGRFLRGQDDAAGRDSEAGSRTAGNLGGATGDAVGSVQDDKTRRPRTTSFSTSTNGNHTHTGPHNVTGNPDGATDSTGSNTSNRSYWRGGYLNSNGIPARGNHTHSISAGGDVETRPQNANVKYIIKAI